MIPTLSHRLTYLILAAMMAVFASLGVGIAWQKSATTDEVPHIGAGLSYLHYGDFRMNPEHPNLVKLAAALPLYLIDPPDMTVEWPEESARFRWWFEGAQHRWGHYLLYRQDDRHQSRLVLARVAPIAFGLLGGWLAFLWGRELAGRPEGGLAAAALLLFYPEYLGHSAYVTFDVPMVTACAAVSWFAWRWWRRPTGMNVVLFAVVAGLASQVKLPASVFIALMLFTLGVLAAFSGRRIRVPHLAMLFGVTALAGFLACWAGAFFRFSLLPTGAELWVPLDYGVPVTRTPLSKWDHLANGLWHVGVLPEATLSTLAHMGTMHGRLVTFFGEHTRGFFSYFLVTMLIKTPLPLLVAMLLLAGSVALRWRRVRTPSFTFPWRAQRLAILLIPFLALYFLVMIGRVNIGHRHILFVYFPVCVLVGVHAMRWLRSGNRIKQSAAAFLLLSQVVIAVWTHPHQATYINAAFGDTYRVSHIINDSNIDWGGDLPLLADWMQRNEVTAINFSFFGTSRPESHGIEDYVFILPDWGQAIDMPSRENPDLTRPTVVSLFTLQWVRDAYPGLYDRDPDVVLNSMVVFLPPYRNRATDAP